MVTTWHELGRPQVHGHDIECVTFLRDFQFASGAEEKVIRVFDAPQSFLQSFSNIAGVEMPSKLFESRALTAVVPALNLSNKAVFEGQEAAAVETKAEFEVQDDEETGGADSQEAADHRPVILDHPPFEEQLFQGTLWVEVEKMYGHPYEIFCVQADHSHLYMASTSKAAHAEHAIIRIWDTKTYKQLSVLTGHALTVTQLAFSHSDEYLLSASRDRSWALFKKTGDAAE